MEYSIEIHTSAGALVQVLENAFDGTLTEAINAPKILTFSIPATDPKLHFATKANEFWVREVVGDTVITKNSLIRQEDIH